MCTKELVLITSCFNESHEAYIDGTEVLKVCELH